MASGGKRAVGDGADIIVLLTTDIINKLTLPLTRRLEAKAPVKETVM
jgi:hypothetical protein